MSRIHQLWCVGCVLGVVSCGHCLLTVSLWTLLGGRVEACVAVERVLQQPLENATSSHGEPPPCSKNLFA